MRIERPVLRTSQRLRGAAAFFVVAVCAALPWPRAIAACYNWYPTGAAAASGQAVPLEIRAARLADAQNGWVAGPRNVLRTYDAGKRWSDVTPAVTDLDAIEATQFRDANEVWLVGATRAGTHTLAHTRDAGASWSQFALPKLGDSTPLALHFVDGSNGWLLLRKPSSSNFQFGELLRTHDGGASWSALPAPPVVGEIVFVSAQVGWLAGGVQGDRLYVTNNGGASWQPQSLPGLDSVRNARVRSQVPRFRNAREGTLAVAVGEGGAARLLVFATADGGTSWQNTASLPARNDDARVVALSAPDAQTLVLAPRADELALRSDGAWRRDAAVAALLPDGAIVALDFSDAAHGWLLQQRGVCEGDKDNCHQETRLFLTDDGARTLADITPQVALPAPPPQADAVSPSHNRCGFDQCAAGTVAQMQAWWSNTPWSDANIYIGGENSACDVTNDARLTPAWIKAVFAQGWHLIPTWVGKQAPTSSCGGCSKLSADPVTARTQGIAEANAAVAKARSIGLQVPTVIYYDMEGYTEPNTATAAFLDGWTERLHQLGITSGVYGGAGEASTDWHPLANRADAVWIARWYTDPLNFPGTVFDIPGSLSNDKWANQQRIRQFQGGHSETWGGVTFSIDRNFEDAPVADYDCIFCDGFE